MTFSTYSLSVKKPASSRRQMSRVPALSDGALDEVFPRVVTQQRQTPVLELEMKRLEQAERGVRFLCDVQSFVDLGIHTQVIVSRGSRHELPEPRGSHWICARRVVAESRLHHRDRQAARAERNAPAASLRASPNRFLFFGGTDAGTRARRACRGSGSAVSAPGC